MTGTLSVRHGCSDMLAGLRQHAARKVGGVWGVTPDLVKSDGSRVLTVERGVLRIVDTATKTVTARLTLADPQRAWGASNLLVEGNRALVILTGGGGVGAPDRVAAPAPIPQELTL
jgi:hypothetical protein